MAARGRRFRRWILGAAALFLVVLLTLVGVAAYIAATHGGARFALGFLERYGVEVAEVRGRLIGPLELRGVVYRDPGGNVEADEVVLRWKPGALLRTRTLAVESLEVRGLVVTLPEADEETPEPTEPPALPEVALPLPVDVEEFRVDGFLLMGPEGQILSLEEIRASVRGQDTRFVLRELGVVASDFGVRVQGELEARDDYPLELDFDWDARFEDLPELAGRGALSGSVGELTVGHRLTAPSEVDLEATLSGLPGDPAWQGRLRAERAQVTPFLPDGPLEWVSLDAQGAGVLADGRIVAEARAGGPELGTLAASLEAEAEDGLVRILGLRALGELEAGQVSMEGSGSIRTGEEPSGEMDLDWWVELPEAPEMSGTARLQGSQERLDGHVRLLRPVVANLEGTVNEPADSLHWSARVAASPFSLTQLDPELPGHRASMTASATGDLIRYRGTGSVQGWTEDREEPSPTAAGEMAFQGNLEDAWVSVDDLVLHPWTGGSVQALGRVDYGGDSPRFQAEGSWSDLVLPEEGERPAIRSPSGRARASGDLDSYVTELESTLAADGFPTLDLHARGEGTDTAFRLDTLTVDGEGLRTSAQGRVSWDPTLLWEGSVTVDEADLEVLEAPVGGRLEGSVSSEGSLAEERILATVDLSRLAYRDGDREVEARALGEIDGDRLRLHDLEVTSAGNRFGARGVVEEEWEMEWELDAPDLSTGLELEGSAHGAGTLSGPRLRPRVEAELEGTGIAAGEARLDSTRVSVLVDLEDREPSRIRAVASGELEPGRAFEGTVSGDGRKSDHRIELAAGVGEEFAGSITLAGGLILPEDGLIASREGEPRGEGSEAPPRWKGTVPELSLDLASIGLWNLREPAALQAGVTLASLTALCLESGTALACLDGEWSEEAGGSGSFDLQGLPLARFADLLPPGVEVAGTLGATGTGAVTPEGDPTGRFQGEVVEGSLSYRSPEGLQETRPLDRARLEGELDAEGVLTGYVEVGLGDGDGLAGEWRAAPIPGGPHTELSGQLDLEIHDRGFLGALSDELANSDGRLHSSLSLGGTVEAPELAGRMELESGTVEILELGIRLEEIQVSASDEGPDEWRIQGGMRSGRGVAELTGRATLPGPDQEAAVEVELSGQDLQVSNSSIARVEASPSLQVRASLDGIDATGTIQVPRADITPGDLEGMVAPSPDVVVVGRDELNGVERQPGLENVRARIRVTMGDSVQFDGFGVTGRVTGAVTIVEEPDRLTRGQGELRLVDGAYTAARQRLTIERGRLVFADGPLENPGLDIRVTRETQDVLAGMEIRGTATDPEISIFSEPYLPEAEAMSYLLIGRPLQGTGGGDGDLLERTATSMGLAGGEALLGRIGPSLGLAEARIDRGEEMSDAALVVGTYFTPRLFVSYGFGLFDDGASVLRLRYHMGQHWIFRTESGRELAADILYSVGY